MGVISDLVRMKSEKDTQAKQGTIDALKIVLTDPNATPEAREWATGSLTDLLDNHFHGKSGGGSGSGSAGGAGKGGPVKSGSGTGEKQTVGSIFKNIIGGIGHGVKEANPYTASGKTKEQVAGVAASRPQKLELTPEEQAEQKGKLDEQAAAIAQKVAVQKQAALAQQKRVTDQEGYEDAFQRNLKVYPNDPVKAREIAEEEVYNKNRSVEPKPPAVTRETATDVAEQAYADAEGKPKKELTAAEKIAAVRAARGTAKAPTKEEAAYAEKHGKKPEELTGSEKLLAVKEARETERLPQRPSLQSGTGGPVPDIREGTPDYKVAQDLASGKLTFSEFRGLFSYSRDATKRAAIYQKASEINPDFNAAAFERGQKFAGNVSVQKQIASIENVKSGVKDLLKMSDEAERLGATLLNNAIIKGGITIGDRKYSDFKTARIAFADELSGALGYGSATDMSREMGFNMTDPALGPKAFKSAIQNVIVPFIERKKKSLTDQMGPYGGGTSGSGTGGTGGTGGAKVKVWDEKSQSFKDQ